MAEEPVSKRIKLADQLDLKEGDDGDINTLESNDVAIKPQCKYFRLCCGKYGVFEFPSELSATALLLNVDLVTYCMQGMAPEHGCDHPTGEKHLLFQLTDFKLMTYSDMVAFAHVVRHPDADFWNEWPTNYILVFHLLHYLAIDAKRCTELKCNLTQVSSFPHAISSFSAYRVTERIQDSVDDSCMELDFFPLLDRLEFLCVHNGHDIESLYLKQERSGLTELLGLEIEILDCLSSTCLLAGGGALKIGCQDTPFTERCDCDIFVLNVASQRMQVVRLLRILHNSGRRIFAQKGNSVFTAVGGLTVRRVQIIISDCSTAAQLIQEFDFQALHAYYDGTTLVATAGAQRDWLTRKCSMDTWSNIVPLRLYSMHWKGFKLSQKAVDFLESTIGFPPRAEVLNDFLFAVPYIGQISIYDQEPLVRNIQNALLYRLHHLLPVASLDWNSIDFKPFIISRYHGNEPCVYHGELPNYVKTCCTKMKEVYSKDRGRMFPTYCIESTMSLEIRAEIYYIYSEEKHEIFDKKLSTLSIARLPALMDQMLRMEIPLQIKNTLLNVTNKKIQDFTETSLDSRFYLKMKTSDVKIFQDGLPAELSNLPRRQTFFGRLVIRPWFFYTVNTGRKHELGFRWQCTHIYWITRA